MDVAATTAKPGAPARLDDRYRLERGRVLLSGTQALVRLPILQRQRDVAAGLNTAGYVSGYRGSPLAGFDREMARAKPFLDASHIVFHPGLNEDLAATAIWGTQQTALYPGARYDGVFSMWYGKGPGVDRSMDAIRHANAAGSNRHGGVLLLMGDDHAAMSSTLPHQSEPNLISASVPILAPAGVAEYLDFGLMGWAMSRFSGAWVGLKCQTEIVETTATVDVSPDRLVIVTPELVVPADGLWLRWPDGPHPMERRLEEKLAAVRAFARANRLDRVEGTGARLGIAASGKSWLDLLAALEALGIDQARAAALGLRLYKIGLVWPLEPEGLRAFADGLEEILVIEEKRPIIEEQIKSLLFNAPAGHRPRVTGKTDENGVPLLSALSELNPGAIAMALLQRLGTADPALAERGDALAALWAAKKPDAPLPVRQPYFCSGCPHSISTVLPEGSRASTGIGCHMMVVDMESETSTFTQMGGEGATWIGLSPFVDERHIFVNMGDGTYFHSGLLAIRAAIAANVNATYKILYNDAVAMTGGQAHDGEVTVPSIVAQMLAEGARRVAVVSEKPEAWHGHLPASVSIDHRDALDRVQRELREVEGVTVLVFDQVCAAEKRRRRKRGTYPVSTRRAFINELVCEGCGDCSAVSNCIAVEPKETEFGRKRVINQSSCNTDLSCIKGFCPSFVTVEGGRLRKPAATAATLPSGALPLPVLPALGAPYNLLVTGIGGTGVITLSAILSEAAHLDGLGVLTIDQTGLAQKNGAVSSHVRFARDPADLHAARIGAGEADLLLGADVVVAASTAAIQTVGRGRTRIVVDDHLTPTAAFVQNTGIDLRHDATMRRVRQAVPDADFTAVPATRLGTALLGDAIAANMFLLGVAWQKGFVPVTLGSLEQAIRLNGAGVDMNLAAFSWGRRFVVEPASVKSAAAIDAAETPAPETLEQMVERRAGFLTAYQNDRYARRYRRLVETARQAEARLGGASGFAEAVAASAFKLMAYKDEYEVARLYRDTGFRDRLAAQFEGDFKLSYHLAPPVLAPTDPRTGKPGKMAFGPWMAAGFAVLARLKFLRGTPLDPFGRTADRRCERQLVSDYFAEIEALAATLDAGNHRTAKALAALPQEVRGFGHVKMAAVERYRERRARLVAELTATPVSVAS